MKTFHTIWKGLYLSVLFLTLIIGKAFSQGTNDYNVCVRNMHQTNLNVLEFDVFIEWTGTNTQKFQFFQGGLNFNYAGLANGGTINGAFVAGSASQSPLLPAVQQAPNWNINQTSKQIRFISAIATPESNAVVTPPPPGMRLGTFRMTNSVPFAANISPNFAWSYLTGTSSTTQTKEAFYLNGSSLATGFLDITPFPNHCPFPAICLGPPCPVCNIGGPYISCGDFQLNGMVSNATGGSYSTSGTGSFDPNNTTLNAIYHPSPADLISGVTITLTATGGVSTSCSGGCTPPISSVVVVFTSIDDSDLCTTDACDQSTGIPTHTAVNTDDNNSCTTDGCDPATGQFNTPAIIDDNDLCTIDACDSSTGIITHIAVNIDDNDACTFDACDPLTGIITHTVIFFDDDNVCTEDVCNPLTGNITHNYFDYDDGNYCTDDGCNSITGIFHNPINVDDEDVCTIDACDPPTGSITHTDDSPYILISVTPIACYNGSTCISIAATGGIPPYFGTGTFCGYTMGTYTFSVSDSRGCTVTTAPAFITEPSKLFVTATATPSTGSDGTATAIVSDGTPGYSYLWTPGGQTSATAVGLAPGNYCVVVTDANGCTASTCVITLIPCDLTAPEPIIGLGGVCVKQSGVFCVTPNQFATSYMWNLPSGVSVIGASNGPCITLKFSSKFKGGYICSKAITPCGTTTNACLFVAKIAAKPSTPGVISGPSSLCQNEITNYSIVPVFNSSSYLWSFSGHLQILSGQGTTSVVVKALSNWTGGSVKVKAVNCKDDSGNKTKNVSRTPGCRLSSTSLTKESLSSIDELSSLSVFPNPTSGNTMLTFNSDRIGNYSLKVVDLLGKIIIIERISVLVGYNSKEINLKNVAKGLYLISIQNEDGVVKTLHLVVE